MTEYWGNGEDMYVPPPLPKEPPPIADFTDEFNRYKKASLLIKNQVADSSKKFDIINNNTVEALMYLTDNIEEIKFMRRDDILKNRHEKICDMLDITFGQINYIEINKFLQRNGIYTNKSMKRTITIINWILVFIIYTSICYFKDISVILMVHGFIGIVLMGFFTNTLCLTLLDSKIRTYRLDKKYRAIIAYRGRP